MSHYFSFPGSPFRNLLSTPDSLLLAMVCFLTKRRTTVMHHTSLVKTRALTSEAELHTIIHNRPPVLIVDTNLSDATCDGRAPPIIDLTSNDSDHEEDVQRKRLGIALPQKTAPQSYSTLFAGRNKLVTVIGGIGSSQSRSLD